MDTVTDVVTKISKDFSFIAKSTTDKDIQTSASTASTVKQVTSLISKPFIDALMDKGNSGTIFGGGSQTFNGNNTNISIKNKSTPLGQQGNTNVKYNGERKFTIQGNNIELKSLQFSQGSIVYNVVGNEIFKNGVSVLKENYSYIPQEVKEAMSSNNKTTNSYVPGTTAHFRTVEQQQLKNSNNNSNKETTNPYVPGTTAHFRTMEQEQLKQSTQFRYSEEEYKEDMEKFQNEMFWNNIVIGAMTPFITADRIVRGTAEGLVGLGYNLVTNPKETTTAIAAGITNKDASQNIITSPLYGATNKLGALIRGELPADQLADLQVELFDTFSLAYGGAQGISKLGTMTSKVADNVLSKKVSSIFDDVANRIIDDAYKSDLDTAIKEADRANAASKSIKEFTNPADPFRDIFGVGSKSNPEEWNRLIKEMEDAGVEIRYREGAMGYGPLRKGEPGQIVIDPDASMSALRHEYSHYLEAQKKWISISSGIISKLGSKDSR